MTSSDHLVTEDAPSQRNLSSLRDSDFDVVIIGGGISGAWLSLHCAQQGLKTALIEKHDYASQTSSSSSKLLHGGIRYLQQMQFDKVRESAMERAHYMHAAPHLSNPVPFAVPTYKDFQRSKLFLNCGMLAYKMLCLGENRLIDSDEQKLPSIRSISAASLNQVCDLSNTNHTGAVVFYEQHMPDSERMVLAVLQTAKRHGAVIYNYVSATDFTYDGDTVVGVQVKDELNGESFKVKSKLVINAAGPWIDVLNSKLKNAASAPRINGFAVGSHIITRQISDHAIALTTKHKSDAKIDRGGRHVFIIPWRGYSLIGTSYDDVDNPSGPIKIQAGHVTQLIEAINDSLPSANLNNDDLISGYSGLYLLHTDNIQKTVYQGSGEYQIIDHSSANGVDGIITALGAKFTTGRKLSELTMDVVKRKLGLSSKVRKVRLSCASYTSLTDFTEEKIAQYQNQFTEKTIRHLIVCYGSDIDAFIARIADEPDLCKKICPHQEDIFGQIIWAIEQEQAHTLDDVLFNRTSLGLLGITDQDVNNVANLMAARLRWSDQQKQQQQTLILTRLDETRQALQVG